MYNKLYQVVYIMVLHYNELSVLNILVLLEQQNKKKARNIYQTNATFIVAFTEQLLFIVKK
jgi:hypothetical protein